MRKYPNPPEFDDAKFSAVYGVCKAVEDGGDWFRRMDLVDGVKVPTLFYREDKPLLANAAAFDAFKRDPSEEDQLREAIKGSALFDDAKWTALTAAQKDAANRNWIQRIVKVLWGLTQ